MASFLRKQFKPKNLAFLKRKFKPGKLASFFEKIKPKKLAGFFEKNLCQKSWLAFFEKKFEFFSFFAWYKSQFFDIEIIFFLSLKVLLENHLRLYFINYK